jgi:uncharacterized protein YjcR
MNEQEHHKKAFEFYYGLGEGRSYNLVAEEFGVALGTVKMWGRTLGWKRRVQQRDAEVARALARRTIEEGIERAARNRKIVEMGLVQVAKAIAEGKVKVTVADLDRLIRLEEFLRDDKHMAGTEIVISFEDYGVREEVGDGDDGTAVTE